MTLIFLFSFAGLALSLFSFLFLFRYVRRRTGAERILSEFRDEIDAMITEVNEVTVRDEELVEARVKKLRGFLEDADRRIETFGRRIVTFDRETARRGVEDAVYLSPELFRQSGMAEAGGPGGAIPPPPGSFPSAAVPAPEGRPAPEVLSAGQNVSDGSLPPLETAPAGSEALPPETAPVSVPDAGKKDGYPGRETPAAMTGTAPGSATAEEPLLLRAPLTGSGGLPPPASPERGSRESAVGDSGSAPDSGTSGGEYQPLRAPGAAQPFFCQDLSRFRRAAQPVAPKPRPFAEQAAQLHREGFSSSMIASKLGVTVTEVDLAVTLAERSSLAVDAPGADPDAAL